MFMAYSQCEHVGCETVTFVAMDKFLSGPGEMMLVSTGGGDICILKRQSEVGTFTKGVKAGSVGIFADLITRCRVHSTGKLPDEWILEDKERENIER